jgi:hypothetical protein
MRKVRQLIIVAVLLFSFCLFVPCVFAQTEQTNVDTNKKDAPKVFIDCEIWDPVFIRDAIKFITCVEELKEAQVWLIITSKETETGMMEYTVSFRGQNEFEGDDDELKYQAEKEKEEEIVKAEILNRIKMGLMRYVGKMPVSSRISVGLMDKVKPTDVEDKWNFWVFSLSASTFLNGDKNYKSGMYNGSIYANRVTPELKIRMGMSGNYSKDRFTYGDEVFKSTYESYDFNGLIVKSISEHWSVGAFFSVFSSKYANVDLSINPAPAIEYNLFPYSESTRRELRLLYRIGYNSMRYREETIYEKTYENLFQQSLSVIYELKRKWGTLSISLEGSHYFHDFSKNRLRFSGDLSLRIVKGLNFDIYGNYRRIRDQLSLPREGASLEELLLQITELETKYSYSVSIGLSYTFGSTRSKVVNPRFGTGGTGISISF